MYLSPDDFKKVSALNSVRAELIDESGEARYKILDIIGKSRWLGFNVFSNTLRDDI